MAVVAETSPPQMSRPEIDRGRVRQLVEVRPGRGNVVGEHGLVEPLCQCPGQPVHDPRIQCGQVAAELVGERHDHGELVRGEDLVPERRP
jgi:hypothetical protein